MKLTAQHEVIAFCQDRQLPAEIVGRWVCVFFPTKPDVVTRDDLKAAGFRFVPKRGGWAHSCGVPSKNGVGDPRFKYGAIKVQEVDAQEWAKLL